MDKIIAVAQREFLATVRTKAFLLSVVLMPGLVVGAMFGGKWVDQYGKQEKRPTRHIAVVDHTGVIYDSLAAQVEEYNRERPNQRFELQRLAPGETDQEELGQRVQAGELYGYMVLEADVLDGEGGGILARQDNQLESGRQLERMINEAVVAVRFRRAQLDPTELAHLRRPVPVRRVEPGTGAEMGDNELARLLTPFAFMFLLFMGTFGISQGLLTALIEEKSSRVVEVLLSALSPAQLLAGKVVGTVLVGFVLMAVWGGVGFASARAYNLTDLVSGYRLLIAGLYFVPGFLLIASLLAAIGSACNELKEAQSMVFPLSLITIVPLIFWFYIAEHPDSLFSLVLSYIPPITPFVMMLRVCADPHTPVWQIVSSLAVLWASVVVAMWAAGKVFRVGVLMYGKPPTPRELLRWVRYT